MTSTTPPGPAAIQRARVRGAQMLLGCDELEPTLSFFLQRLHFRIEAIYPADNPTTAMISGYGLQLRLVRGAAVGASLIYLLCDDPIATGGGQTEFVAPNGVRVQLVAADPPMVLPVTQQALVITRGSHADSWVAGRAGLQYRDLLPQRHGGAFIASHIRILEGGPVPDYVHFHKIRFQVIYCRKGWVRVAYEGQGPALLMQPGDCVLQPPLIRHRVLESSAGAEVVEICAPAAHVTVADNSMDLPNADLQPGRDFGGQQFVFHVASGAPWAPWRGPGFEMRDTGIGQATRGLAGVRVMRPHAATASVTQAHATEFCFYFVLSGTVSFVLDGQTEHLGNDNSITIPGDMPYSLTNASADLSLLEVTLPADVPGLLS